MHIVESLAPCPSGRQNISPRSHHQPWNCGHGEQCQRHRCSRCRPISWRTEVGKVMEASWFPPCEAMQYRYIISCYARYRLNILVLRSLQCDNSSTSITFFLDFPWSTRQNVIFFPKTAHSTPYSKKNLVAWAAVLWTKSTQDLYSDIARADGIRGHKSPQHAASVASTFFYSLFLLTLSHLSSRYLCLGSRLVCFAAEGARTKHGRTEHRARWKLNDSVARKKSRRELAKRVWKRRYQ